jgi:hypothetical protein
MEVTRNSPWTGRGYLIQRERQYLFFSYLIAYQLPMPQLPVPGAQVGTGMALVFAMRTVELADGALA